MTESSASEIGLEVGAQISVVERARARLTLAMQIEREGARDREAAACEIRAAYLVIAHLLRGSIGPEFIDVFRSISK